MKKFFGIFLALVFVLTLLLIPPLTVSADGALDYAEEAPGGFVTDRESFIAAFGEDEKGRPNAEAVSGNATDIRLRSSVILRAPIIVYTGSYRIIGGGCTVARGFSAGPLIILEGNSLANAPSLTVEKPYETEWSDNVEPGIVFSGNAGAYPDAEGALLAVSGHATLTVNGNVLFKDASSALSGAAIFAECGSEGYENTPLVPKVNVRYCKFTDCTTKLGGGAIGLSGFYEGTDAGELDITGCVFDSNKAENEFESGEGGAVWSVGGSVVISGCKFNGNKADLGGAVYTCSDTSVVSCTFESNESNVSGAAVYCGKKSDEGRTVYATATFGDVNALYNRSFGNGGFMTCDGIALIEGAFITENETAGNGTIYNTGYFGFNEGTVYFNKCSGIGGAVYCYGENSIFIMNGGEINNNKAEFVSGVYSGGSFKMAGGAIGNNKGEGPAVLIKGEFVFGPNAAISNKNAIGLCAVTGENGTENFTRITLSGELTSLMEHKAYFCREETDADGKITGYSYEDPKGKMMFSGSAEEIASAIKIFSVYSESVKKYRINPDGSISGVMPVWGWIIIAVVFVGAGVGTVILTKRHKKRTIKK